MTEEVTYKNVGVDIRAADDNQKIIKNFIKETYSKFVIPDNKGLGAMFEIPPGYKNPVLISGTDSVGTKLRLAFELDKHDTIGIDAVALCVNDTIRRGARPLFFLDFIGIGKLKQENINSIVQGIIEGCRQAGCSLIGGETAQLPETYPEDEYELVGFSVGIVDKDKMVTGDNIRPGDMVIGLASSGIHSNGYTLARKALLSKNKLSATAFDGGTIGEAMMEPSRIYVRPVLDILENHRESITGLANITGSAFNKLLKLNANVGFRIDKLMNTPKVFNLIQREGNISDKEMFSTFNMGIGFIIIARKADFITGFEEKYGYKAEIIGVVDESKKVIIKEKNLVL
jgi:phosphoribosylformylglycinamidine cyclo-ligase